LFHHEQRFRRQTDIFEKTLSDSHHRNSAAFLPLERETYLDRHLPMTNLVLLDLSARLEDFEPAKIAQTLRSLGNGVLNCVFNAVGGRAHEFDLLVDMIAHAKRIRFPSQRPKEFMV
jgi:hypothetical protein